MGEKTKIVTMKLKVGQDWAWFADLNVVALAEHLCAEGRERALSELQIHWRRSCLYVVPDLVDGATSSGQVAG